MTRVLEVSGLEGGYGTVQILYGIDMHVDEGEFVTVIGPNGCGKSTFIKTIFGIATYYRGGIQYRGEEVSGWRTDQLVNHGIAYVPQVDNVFPSLSVLENLQMGGNSLSQGVLAERIERSLEMFPDLRNREYDLAASLSGGERQMLAISRALISDRQRNHDSDSRAERQTFPCQVRQRIHHLQRQGSSHGRCPAHPDRSGDRGVLPGIHRGPLVTH